MFVRAWRRHVFSPCSDSTLTLSHGDLSVSSLRPVRILQRSRTITKRLALIPLPLKNRASIRECEAWSRLYLRVRKEHSSENLKYPSLLWLCCLSTLVSHLFRTSLISRYYITCQSSGFNSQFLSFLVTWALYTAKPILLLGTSMLQYIIRFYLYSNPWWQHPDAPFRSVYEDTVMDQ